MAKKKQSKISKVKRNNQTKTKLAKQGKLKVKRNGKQKKQTQKPTPPKPEELVEEEEESDHGEDMMGMVEKDDLEFLQNAISNKSYNLLKHIRLNKPDPEKSRKGKRKNLELAVEDKYEEETSKENGDTGSKKIRLLLPVKTQAGIITRQIVEEDEEEEEEEPVDIQNGDAEEEPDNSDEEVISEIISEVKKEEDTEAPVSTAELLACREEVLKSRRFKIGLLSSSLLENPEMKSGNFKILLEMMDERNPEVYITVRKLATVSLLEVFKDLLPSYSITQIAQEGVKFKKETLKLQNYEAVLLRSYKHYLQKLEKMGGKLRKKRGDTRVIGEREIQLGELAVHCLCDLLITHPYFNFSVNIANFLLPLLDNKRLNVRETIAACFKQIFKDDKRGDLTLTIVRRLNQYIKLRGHSVHVEVIAILLALRIKDIDLDKEREEEAKQKKLMSHKQRILALSKRERKRNKKLEHVEQEMLETKAEENKQTKQKVLTEITSVVFTIYFRILKQAPNSKVLSSCLEGLAKFAHCINLEFYQDLVSVINRLMEEGNLGQREQLHCIQTVFTILSGQGSALNIDPYRFYSHLYKNLLTVHAGKHHGDAEIIIRTLVEVLIHRRKRVTQNRMIAFIKRIATMALQLQHNGTLGILGIIKSIMQLSKSVDILLDTDANAGDGFYQPELEEPEYCNAHCSALWELVALQMMCYCSVGSKNCKALFEAINDFRDKTREVLTAFEHPTRHYHSTVQKVAKNIAWGVPTSGEGSLPPEVGKLSAEDIYQEYDPTGVVFKPAVPLPKKAAQKKISSEHEFGRNTLEQYLEEVENEPIFVHGYVDFYKAIQIK